MRCNRCKKANLAKLANSDGDTRYYCKDCLNTWIILSEANQKKIDDEESARKAKLAKTFAIIKQCTECKSDNFGYASSFDCFGGTGHFRVYHCDDCDYRYTQREHPKDE